MKFIKITLIFIAVFYLSQKITYSQDSKISVCEEFLVSPFISDGQQYTAQIKNEKKTETFNMLFYRDLTYRIIVCADNKDNKIEFTLFDEEKNILFSNKNYNYINYWDFKFNSTMKCTVETKFKDNTEVGNINMLIGFKQKNK